MNLGNIIWSPDSNIIAFIVALRAIEPYKAIWGGLDEYLCVIDINKKIEKRIKTPEGIVISNLEWDSKDKKLYYATDDIYVLNFEK